MTAAIKRYDLVFSEHFGGGIGAKENGKFCEYDDYLKVLKRAEEAEARVSVLEDDLLIEWTFHEETLGRESVLMEKLTGLVPDEMNIEEAQENMNAYTTEFVSGIVRGFNTCRAAILRNIETGAK